MKGIETGKDKVKKICEALRKETLEPALREAEEIVHRAGLEAEKIVGRAQQEAESLTKKAKEQIEKDKGIFNSSLNQAGKQAIQFLKQSIEEKLFNKELSKVISEQLRQPNVIAQLITAVVNAIEKEGIVADLSAFIPAEVPAAQVNALLAKNIIERLKEKSVLLSPIGGGIEVKIRDENMTIDMSDTALKELVANYIRKDFRELFFGSI